MQTHDSSRICTHTFADRHIHGIAGVDFATSSVSEIRAALTLLASRRTTTVTASVPTVELSVLGNTLDRLRILHAEDLLAGVHLEGPFISADFAGAHPHNAILDPDSNAGRAFLDTVFEYQADSPSVTMMTVAPEVAGFEHLVSQLALHGIETALGHTGASYEQMRHAIEVVHGHTGQPVVITHLYNAMRGFHHRDPGPLLAILEAVQACKVIVELIADEHHVDMALIRWWFDHHPAAVRLVSDASAATHITSCAPLSDKPPRLGHMTLQHGKKAGPMLTGGHTIASGGKDLLAIHDGLVAAGLDHDLVCTAMRGAAF